MADKKISALTAATTPLDGTEVLPIVQSGSTVKVANNDLRPKQIQSNATSGVLQITGPAAASTRVMTTPNANFTVARTDAAQTFTGNQTINGNVGINTTPAAWGSDFYAAQISDTGAAIYSYRSGATSDEYMFLTNNAYNNNTNDLYVRNGAAAQYTQINGTHTFARAATGTAGNAISWINVIETDASSNVKVSAGNLVQGTAAKGVNFTANTPQAGMTSQLLNWYEEGTFTPTATAGSGTITSYTATGHYTRVGKTVTIFVSIEITNPGSASGNLSFAALPFTSKNVGGWIASVNAREDNVTGTVFDVLIQGNATTGLVLNANWTTNVKYLFSATYLLA